MSQYLTSFLMILTIIWHASIDAASLRVDADWLSENLEKISLTLLDTRPAEDFLAGHIPGAINFPDELTYQKKEQSGLIVQPDKIQRLLRERGIDAESFVVIYDAGSLIDAARVFWTLEVYGLQKVRILNGGFAGWKEKQRPISTTSAALQPSDYVVQVNHRRIASKFSTRLATLNPNQVVIDARSEEAYRGETSTAKRFGHIPSAINISVHENFIDQATDGKYLLPLNDLKKLYQGVPKDSEVILYCEIGRISTTNYLTLRELGYDAANYDASWREWGNDFSLPIEK
jgi:thiosulfate/3-mercaptopyruvate sulfurtransferase